MADSLHAASRSGRNLAWAAVWVAKAWMAEITFEPGDNARDRRWGHAKGTCRSGKALKGSDFQKNADRLEFLHRQ